ncbi:UbiE/COQ5 methyltransferase [Russula aff. rugulosa BPL654]|nr:UbiE/COQ5 methyltransferase [Russula aff. rugulosa BPL654]
MQAVPRGLRTVLTRAVTQPPRAARPCARIRYAHTGASTSNGAPSSQPNTTSSESTSTTHFGFRTVPEGSKEALVRGVFDSVASSYDIMNDAMSLGVHRLWKDSFISLLRPGSKGPIRCIDVAGGTGDIALRILDHARETHGDRETRVDIEGQMRFKKTMYHNTPQAHRVLKPGGTFACLEFNKVTNPLLAQLYDQYSFSMIPLLGTILAGDRASYQYLVESIRRFPSQGNFARMIAEAGFAVGGDFEGDGGAWRDLWGGIACIHTGVKL